MRKGETNEALMKIDWQNNLLKGLMEIHENARKETNTDER